MPNQTDSTEVFISGEALEAAWFQSFSTSGTQQQVRDILEASAPMIVADELDRIAGILDETAAEFGKAGYPTRAEDYAEVGRVVRNRSTQLRNS